MNIDRFLEVRVHGDSMFPLNVYMIDYLDGDAIFSCHWHPEMELLYLEEGSVQIQLGSTMVTIEAGEAIIVPSGQLHAAYRLESNNFRLHAIVFNTDLIKSFTYDAVQSKYIDLIIDPNWALPTHIKGKLLWEKNLLSSIQEIIKLYQSKETAFELVIKAYLFMLISEFLKHNQLKNKKDLLDSVKINRLKQVLQFIDQHFYENLTIEQLAGLIQMSEGHFSRFFKSIIRMTPIEYINTIRINKAAKLLRENDRKIIEIAMEVGFDHPSYFIKLFKQHKKCTPSVYRNSII